MQIPQWRGYTRSGHLGRCRPRASSPYQRRSPPRTAAHHDFPAVPQASLQRVGRGCGGPLGRYPTLAFSRVAPITMTASPATTPARSSCASCWVKKAWKNCLCGESARLLNLNSSSRLNSAVLSADSILQHKSIAHPIQPFVGNRLHQAGGGRWPRMLTFGSGKAIPKRPYSSVARQR